MSVTTLDTHEVVKSLQAVGFSVEQAEAVTRVVRDSHNRELSNLATKSDLSEAKFSLKAEIQEVRAEIQEVKAELKAEIQEVRAEIQEVKAELKAEIQEVKAEIQEVKAELKAEIQEVKAELKAEIQELRTDLAKVRTEMAEMKAEIIKWVIGVSVAQAGLVLAMLRFMH